MPKLPRPARDTSASTLPVGAKGGRLNAHDNPVRPRRPHRSAEKLLAAATPSYRIAALRGLDRDGGYGWISIALHWLTAVAIIVLLFAGDSIGTVGEQARRTHTTIASCVWLLLAGRIAWRLWQGHPRAPGVGARSYYVGLIVHYSLLAGVALMLVSGPLAGWSSGSGIQIFDLHMQGAHPGLPQVYQLSRIAHVAGATLLAVGISAHFAGVLKHMFIDRDSTLDRIMVPPRRRPPDQTP